VKFYRDVILPSGLLSGTIIGAGVFALPFIFKKSGFITGFLYLVIFAGIFSIIYLMHADTIIKTPGLHNYVGYARLYLGKEGFYLALLSAVIAMLLSLVVYLVLSISFLNLIFGGGGVVYKILVFWIIGSLCVFLKVKAVALSETLITGAMVLIIGLVFILGLGGISENTFVNVNVISPAFIFLPFGPVLFSLAGRSAIPSLVEYFKKTGQKFEKIKTPIIIGTLLPTLVYTLFVVGVFGLSNQVSSDAVTGMKEIVSPPLMAIIGILGLLAIISSYIMIGQNVRDIFEEDLKVKTWWANGIVILLPLVLYIIGFQNFLQIIALTGGIFLALDSILVVLIWWRSRRRYGSALLKKLSPTLGYVLIIAFLIGAISEVIY